ncbi:hypothetical protein LEP1GSC059_3873 [Leptospira noguchii serovar Panama str. CZ214]|uniref:Uncharacterized protein n=1 Tax=Leptospira noguchii serovar Panama str. CZ214 TaxID=1001595 RepID=T0GYA2_9LEPT|nr:hypothetical protein LEP1GSC059_3873 [Leptospira noguchii serovar Panama str. CZ214]
MKFFNNSIQKKYIVNSKKLILCIITYNNVKEIIVENSKGLKRSME